MTRFSLLLLPAFAIACFDGPITKDGTACTEMAAASVMLTVTDANDAEIPGASAEWTGPDGAAGTCDSLGNGTFNCGYEVSGEISVTVSAEGYDDVTKSVVVDHDECHVIGESLTVVLEESEAVCDEMAAASIQVTLLGASAETLEDQVVQYRDAMVDDAEWMDCDDISGTWVCGWEVTGTFDVSGTASGHDVAYAQATVVLDEAGCHPVTQNVTLQVDWLPD